MHLHMFAKYIFIYTYMYILWNTNLLYIIINMHTNTYAYIPCTCLFMNFRKIEILFPYEKSTFVIFSTHSPILPPSQFTGHPQSFCCSG